MADQSSQESKASSPLAANVTELAGCTGKNVKEDIRFLVPFCGSLASDLIHLYRQGYSVIGIDASKASAEKFFQDYPDLQYQTRQLENIPSFMSFQTLNKRLELFVGDILDLETDAIGGPVDCVWDGRALATVDVSQRQKYFTKITSLLNQDFGYLLEGYEVDPANSSSDETAVKNNLSHEQLLQLCSDELNVNVVGQAASDDVTGMKKNVYLITRKGAKRLQHWHSRWATSKTGWHKQEINAHLKQHFDALTDGNKTNLNFFFPLCGKTKDMLWVYEQGHKVVGVEAVSVPVQQFFEESKLEFSKERLSSRDIDGWIYASGDGRLRIFVCDLFKISPELIGPVDCVFDRGSYVAIESSDRKPYIELMYSIYGCNTRHLIVSHEYDESKFGGPPRNVDRKELPAFFKEIGDKVGKTTKVECLGEELVTDNLERFNLTEMILTDFLITSSG